jgi:hypothetical protein
MQLDKALPHWDQGERHLVPCDAPPATRSRTRKINVLEGPE